MFNAGLLAPARAATVMRMRILNRIFPKIRESWEVPIIMLAQAYSRESAYKRGAPVWLKFKHFHASAREKMASVFATPLHGSTQAILHTN